MYTLKSIWFVVGPVWGSCGCYFAILSLSLPVQDGLLGSSPHWSENFLFISPVSLFILSVIPFATSPWIVNHHYSFYYILLVVLRQQFFSLSFRMCVFLDFLFWFPREPLVKISHISCEKKNLHTWKTIYYLFCSGGLFYVVRVMCISFIHFTGHFG